MGGDWHEHIQTHEHANIYRHTYTVIHTHSDMLIDKVTHTYTHMQVRTCFRPPKSSAWSATYTSTPPSSSFSSSPLSSPFTPSPSNPFPSFLSFFLSFSFLSSLSTSPKASSPPSLSLSLSEVPSLILPVPLLGADIHYIVRHSHIQISVTVQLLNQNEKPEQRKWSLLLYYTVIARTYVTVISGTHTA